MGENMTDFTDTEENWMKDQGINTTYRKLFWSKMRRAMGDRREFDGPLPDGVTEDRRKNDELREMEKLVKAIHANTRGMPSFFKVWRDMFRKGAGDLDEHVLKK
jgi:hypothetical protein